MKNAYHLTLSLELVLILQFFVGKKVAAKVVAICIEINAYAILMLLLYLFLGGVSNDD